MTHRIEKYLVRGALLASVVAAGTVVAGEPSAMLPVGGLSFIERPGKQPPALISANGRYVLTVALYDRWTGRIIATPDQASRAATRLDLDAMGLKLADLAPVTLGHGPNRVVVFADPLDEDSQKVVRTFVESPNLQERYTVQLLVVPTSGKRSGAIAQRLACTEAGQVIEAMTKGRYGSLPNRTRCGGVEGLQRRMATALLLGVTGMPYLIAPDGRVRAGLPDDLEGWLGDGAK